MGGLRLGFGNADFSTTAIDVLSDTEFDFTTGSVKTSNGVEMKCGRTTSARQLDANGNEVSVAANVPRFSRNPLTGQILGLLCEPSATNLLTYNDDLTNAVWIKNNCTVSQAGSVPGLDGAAMFKLEETASNTYHGIDTSLFSVSFNGYLSCRVFVKAAERNFVNVELGFKPESVSYKVIVNLTDGTFTAVSAGTVTGNAKVTACKNGIYLVEISAFGTAGSTGRMSILPNDGTRVSYQGVAGSGIYLQYPQLEASPRSTSTIVTHATQVTRAADNCYVDAKSLATVFDPLSYTIFTEAVVTKSTSAPYVSGEVSPTAVALYDPASSGSTPVTQLLGRRTTDLLPCMFSKSAPSITVVIGTSWTSGARRMAVTNGAVFSVGGIGVGRTGFASMKATMMQIGSAQPEKEYFEGYVKRVRIYLTALSLEMLNVLTA